VTAPQHILVVDDDRVLRELLRRMLESAGFSCTAVPDAAAAVEQLRDDEYALVLSDVEMPGASGVTLARVLCAARPELPVLLMSAAGGEREAEARQAGARAFLVKPFSPQVALEQIRIALT
jgi:DNA-binding response OmpR family regulator